MKQSTLQLLKNYLAGMASPEETARIDKWYEQTAASTASSADEALIKEQLYQRIQTSMQTGASVVPLYRQSFFKYAAAACIIFMLGIGSYLLLIKNNIYEQSPITSSSSIKDIEAPKATKAMIVLADGRKVPLDSLASGTLLTQGSMTMTKTADGQLIYSGASTEIAYNTLYNPRGSTVINLTLSDGTKVWLNSESSLRYPVAFNGNSRRVEITGEGYFEVAHDAAKKFLVDANGVIIEVLGTHFNVNSYTDENATKITLLQGLVQVSKGAISGLLKPGQQAQVDGTIRLVTDVNTDEVIAWKEGKFQFGEKADVKAVMRQISRWYDVEVEYQGEITGHLGGGISRNVNVSQVFKMLETTGVAKFRLAGKKVIVTAQ